MIHPGLPHQTEQMHQLRRRYTQASWTGPVCVGTSLAPDRVLKEGLPATGGGNFDLHSRALTSSELERAGV